MPYFLVRSPVKLTYDVNGVVDSGTLAAAVSGLISAEPGFFPTLVMNKLITGIDSNGGEADGEIDRDFSHSWELGDDVGFDDGVGAPGSKANEKRPGRCSPASL